MHIGPAQPVRPAAGVSRHAAGTVTAAESSGAPARAVSLGDRLHDAAGSVGDFFKGLGTFARHLFQPTGTWTNPALPVPPDRGGLTIMSYNVMVKTTRYDAVKREIAQHRPDVVSLQETSEASARKLASDLGYHVAWHENPFHTYGGNAILSRYPIKAAENIDLAGSFKERFGEFWTRAKDGSYRMGAMDKRHMLHATLQVGDRSVDVLDGHLTLFGAGLNTQQLDQIGALAKRYEQQGHSVVLSGDWNTNVAMSGPNTADANGTLETPTDTNAEYRDRWRGMGVGNNGQAANMAAMNRLRDQLNYFWDAPTRTVLVEGQLMTPEQAIAELRSGTLDPQSTRYQALRRAADGSTVLGSAKRFDNVFTSKDMRFTSAHIDQTTQASDHQPVVTEVRWD
jgi:endonuclease/exonuclease/phosphatase family metal-dependent hydrolase